MAFLLFRDNTRTDLTGLVSGQEKVFGSAYDCDIQSFEAGVAERHAIFLKKGEEFYLRPFSKKNFFFIQDREENDLVLLKHRDVIRIGEDRLEFYLREPEEGSPEERKDLLKSKLHQLLLERINLKKIRSGDDSLRTKAMEVIEQLINECETEIIKFCPKEDMKKEIIHEALGLGILEEFLSDPEITEIMVKNAKTIYLEKKGKIQLAQKTFLNNEQLLGIIERIVSPLGRRIDESSPIVDARLSDGSRVNAVIPPVALDGPALTIRKFSKTPFKVPDLIRFGALTGDMATLIGLAVKYRQNVVISGGTGSGKTTLLNVSASFIPADERIVTIEDSAELQLPQDHVIRLEARPANIEGRGRISIRDLVINSLRMRPDRVVVGECRGGESLDMLQAMNTGHDGSMTTLHANAPKDALARLETMVLMSGMELPSRAIREQIAMAVNIIIQQARLADGTRKITHITEITGIEETEIRFEHIVLFRQTGISPEGKILGQHEFTGYVPRFIRALQEKGIEMPMHLFTRKST